MEERNLEKLAKLSLKTKAGIGLNVAFNAPIIAEGVKNSAKEWDTVNKTKEYYKTGFKNGLKPLSANNPLNANQRPLDKQIGNYPSYFKQADEDDNGFVKDAYKFLPVGAALAIGGAAGVQIARGKMQPSDLIKPVKNVGTALIKPLKNATKISKNAKKIADKAMKNRELTEEYKRYVARTGDINLTEDAFKALYDAFQENSKKFYKNTPMDFDRYIEQNRDRMFDKLILNGAKERQEPKKNLKKEFNNFFRKTFDDSLNGLVVSGVMGAGVTGGSLAMNAIGDEYYRRKDNAEMRREVRKNWNTNVPHQLLLGKNNKLDPNYTTYYTPEERIERIIRDEVRQTAKHELRKQRNFNNTQKPVKPRKPKKIQKQAAMTQKTKDFIKQNIIGDTIGGLAYAVAPATTFGIMNRDRYNWQKIDSPKSSENQKKKTQKGNTHKTVLEFKNEDELLNKQASVRMEKIKKAGKKFKKDFVPDDLGTQVRDRAVRGIVNTVPVAMVAGITNRNLRGNMERFDSEQYAKNVARPLERGNIRVTIERGDD